MALRQEEPSMRDLREVAEEYFKTELRLAQLKHELIQVAIDCGADKFFSLNFPALRQEFDPHYAGRPERVRPERRS